MSAWPADSPPLVWGELGDEERRTHPRVQVISLFVAVVASSALVAATHLPWFGPFSSDGVNPHYSAVSGVLVPPGSPAGLVPGTQKWGYVIIAWSVLLAGLALVAAVSVCRESSLPTRPGPRPPPCVRGHRVIDPDSARRARTRAASSVRRAGQLGFSWGTVVGLALAVASSIGAWFAWATLRFPYLWSSDPLVNSAISDAGSGATGRRSWPVQIGRPHDRRAHDPRREFCPPEAGRSC